MRQRSILMILAAAFLLVVLAGCASDSDPAPKAVEAYLQSLVAEDGDRIADLVCADWEQDVMLELDNSFMGVSARLEDMSCTQTV